MKYTKILAIVGLALSGNAFAGNSTVSPEWSFLSSSAETGSVSGSGVNTVIHSVKDGISLEISAWSSSLHNNVASCKDSHGQDLCIQRSQLTQYNGGLGVINGDEGNDTPNHSIDNNNQDYDMVLLSFSEEINISSLYTGWNYQYNHLNSDGTYTSRSYNDAGASVMAFTDTNSAVSLSSSSNNYSTLSWADLTSVGWTNIGSDFSSNGSGEIAVSSGNTYSKYWLVGAAHSIERDAGNLTDHIKLAGISFAQNVNNPPPSTQVNAPATALMTFLIAGFALYRRKS
ncbi:exosortase-dependent surface protein XDP1 [Glaciecola sp. 2405UD65-10]|uniref:exosortase-dependent surface protein XDP1 n=1 Tax=Glaciecola sp. 2405UD65-10 TaxID=3397244 RepID=UPI003B5C89B0